jgi:cytochrome P450
MGFMDE